MTPVEDRLGELLHTAVPPSHGVPFDDVQRRVRRRRAAQWSLASAAVSAAVVVAAVAVAADPGSSHRSRVTTSTPVNLAGAVPWVDEAAAPYRAPTGPPPSRPATNARPCSAGDVAASLADGNGAGGHSVRYVRFRNTSTSTCVLKGYPHVTASEPGHRPVAATDGSFFPTDGTANMRPGHATYLGVETDTYCAARPGGGSPGPAYHHLDVVLPGGGRVPVDVTARGFDVSCGLHLTRFFVPKTQPRSVLDPLSDLTVSLEVPGTVAAGSTLVYVADVANPTDQAVSLARCPGYVETLAGRSPLKAAFGLNCAPVGAVAAHDTVRFEMRLDIPAQAGLGRQTLRWAIAGPFSVIAQAAITVTD